MRKLFTLSVSLMVIPFLVAACSDTESRLLAPDAVDLSYVGYEGTTDGVPESATSVPHSSAFPSTNAGNIAKEPVAWANVTWNSDDAGVGEAPLKFESNRNFLSCFEYRIDDEEVYYPGADNPNTDITDGRWQFTCVQNSVTELPITANRHVDVRLAFGAETDERFDWTRFYVMTEMTKDDCKKGQWEALGFQNQGQCIRYVETGKDSRVPQPAAEGDVVWTSGPGVAGYHTVFRVYADNTGTALFYAPNGDLIQDMTVECVAVDGNEVWFGDAGRLFWAQDNSADATQPDRIGSWDARNCSYGFPGTATTWRGTGTVTDGNLTVF
jgi:hypothetical protein